MDMKQLCRSYIRHTTLIGALYSIVPVVIWFGAMIVMVPFRDVYVLRFALSILLGSYVAAKANTYGVRMWLIKHHSPIGPATMWDGAIIGACVGMTVTLLPPLTSLIATNHPEQAKWFIIGAWLVSIMSGIFIGAAAGRMGKKHITPDEALCYLKHEELKK